MNGSYIQFRRRKLIITMWHDIKLTGKTSEKTHLIAKQIKKDILENVTTGDDPR